MKIIVNIPEETIPKKQCIFDLSMHFLDGELVEYTVPSGWSMNKQSEQRKGYWVKNGELYRCSECGELACCQGRYCNECGSPMEVEE